MELLTNYFKVATRTLFRQKIHTGLNIMGLAIGLTFSILIFLYVAHEMSYDKFHTKADRIYLLPMTWHFNGTDMPTAANCSVGGPFMKQDFPEVEEYVRFLSQTISFRNGNEVIKEKSLLYADSSFFKVFTFPLVEGNPAAALTDPFSIVITRSAAKRYFGDEWQKGSLLGKTIVGTNNRDYQITGVAEDVPSNSHLNFDFLVSISTLPSSRKELSWDNSEYYTYVLLTEQADPKKIVSEIPGRLDKRFFGDASKVIELDLVPLTNIQLYNTKYRMPNTSQIMYVRIFSLVAFLVLLIATVNYINMATARSMERAQEVGIRKVMGAQRAQLFYQFLSESLVITAISLVLAVVFAWVLLPVFNALTEKTLNVSTLITPQNILLMIVGVIGISLLSGFYPALFVSGYMPAKVLKGKLKDSVQGIRLRKALVITQFLISILLIICTFMISSQINYAQSKDPGFDRKQLVSLSLDSISRTQLNFYKNELAAETAIAGTTASIQLPTNITHQTALSKANQTDENRQLMSAISVDSEFIKTVGLEIVAGTQFTPNIEKTSDTWEIILNESAAAFLGWTNEEAINKGMIVWQKEGTVKGVVKDFNFTTIHNPIAPLVIFSGKGATYSNLIVNVSGSPADIRNLLEKSWRKTNPDSPFILTFLDEQYESLYKKESQLKNIINLFAMLAIIISNFGLFGLASYTILQRTKEMGIRKALGASVSNLIVLVSRYFVRLVIISFLLAIPLSWYLMDKWLSTFAYHISFNWWIVIIAGVGSIVLALVTVVYHAFQVTRVSPAETLKAQ